MSDATMEAILAEMRALRSEVAELREENAALREDVTAIGGGLYNMNKNIDKMHEHIGPTLRSVLQSNRTITEKLDREKHKIRELMGVLEDMTDDLSTMVSFVVNYVRSKDPKDAVMAAKITAMEAAKGG